MSDEKKVEFEFVQVSGIRDTELEVSRQSSFRDMSKNESESKLIPDNHDLVRIWVQSQCSCVSLNRRWHSMEHIACLKKARSLCDSLFQVTATNNMKTNQFINSPGSKDISWAESLDSIEGKREEAENEWKGNNYSIPWYKVKYDNDTQTTQQYNSDVDNLYRVPADSLEFL